MLPSIYISRLSCLRSASTCHIAPDHVAPSEFAALKQQILTSLDAYESALRHDKLPNPQMIQPKLDVLDNPDRLPSWELTRARKTLVASLRQMQLLVTHPGEAAMNFSFGHHFSAALSLAVDSRVADALLTANSSGMPHADLSQIVGVNKLVTVR